MEIIPAIIPKDFEDLKEKLNLVKGLTNYVQIDILDGIFVPNKSWPFTDVMWKEGIHLELPSCDNCNFEFDLMVKDPENIIDEFIDIGAKRIVIHIDSTQKIDELINRLKGIVQIGLAFSMENSIEKYEGLINNVDFIQLMGIEKIGFQGEPFSKKVIKKIKDLRKKNSNVIISVDGGVNLENAPLLIKAGVNRLVSGSTILNSSDISKTIDEFKKIDG